MILLITVLALFFALNMGGASFAAAFAAPYGGRFINQHKAALLFIVFVIFGSLLLGQKVSITLGRDLVPADLINMRAVTVIFFSAGMSMFVSNMMKIPQSTSFVTVAAIAGVGAYHGRLNVNTFYYLLPFWVLLPMFSYLITHLLTGWVYPPRQSNFWVYERFINHQNKLKKLVIAMSCYSAFAVGTNNVANVAGPLMGSVRTYSLNELLFVFAIIYGAGAFVFTEPLKTAGEKVVPLGLLTATIISLVCGSLMLVASAFGVPQSFVMLNMGAIFAVSSLKDGHHLTFRKPLARRALYTWTINPIITFFVSWGLSALVL